MGNSQSSSSGQPKASASSSSGLRTRSNTSSSDSRVVVDGGFLEPQSLLYAHQDYHRPTVHKLIQDRKLSPFYLGLVDFEDDWDEERLVQALAEAEAQATVNLKDALTAANEAANDADAQQINAPPGTRKHKEAVQAYNHAVLHRERLAEVLKQREKRGGGGLQYGSKTEHAKLYRGRALECPICFLYYPPNMVHTRCCDQPICTECFVQIKRAEPTPTHLESEPAACPFCMEPNFGAVYARPAPQRPGVQSSASGDSGPFIAGSAPKPRRKSYSHTEKEVVTTDMIHPDWEAKLEAMKATVARRANRRIVFRQVGDRLIPVGITSGRAGDGANPTMATTTLPPNFLSQIAAALDASNENGGSGSSSSGRRRGSRSSRRRGNSGANDEVLQLLESLGLGGGPDIEELMVQEAMRLSQLEEEERQKKAKAEEEEKAKKAAAAGGAASPVPAASAAGSSSSPSSDRSPRTTERLLSEAMTGSALSTSPSSSPAARSDAPSPALGALAAGGLAAAASSPSTSSAFSQPGESAAGSSLGRGIVGAGLAAASTSRAGSSPSASPPSVSPAPIPNATSPAPLINLDIPSTPLEPPELDTPIAARSTPAPLSSSSAADADASPVPELLAPTPDVSSSAVSLAPSEITTASSSVLSDTPSAGYEPLADGDSELSRSLSSETGTADGAGEGREGRLVDL
ncbi:hypothetical protein JCM8097_008748 [Rhodosporidiobolus ruineniae]